MYGTCVAPLTAAHPQAIDGAPETIVQVKITTPESAPPIANCPHNAIRLSPLCLTEMFHEACSTAAMSARTVARSTFAGYCNDINSKAMPLSNKVSSDSPIGMFDSGFGGLTVARALIDLMPQENLVYIGDTGRYPYGNKPADEVRGYAKELAWSLVREYGAKMIVVACNTAASVALDELVDELPVPVIGVIDPGARALVRVTRNNKVGVIGTVGTISSGAYVQAIRATGASVALTSAACPGFVEFVERDQTTGDEVMVLAERLLAPVRDAGVDALLLGCTHYPYLSRVISDVMGPEVVLVSSADETAFIVKQELEATQLMRTGADNSTGEHKFLSSGDIAWFAQLGRRLLGPELETATQWKN
jgi:glutamate racemase